MSAFYNRILSSLYKPLDSSIIKDNIKIDNLKNFQCSKKLDYSLKKLEFINCLETNLDINNADSYSLSFLQELERLRYRAQAKIFQSLKDCNN